MIKLFHCSFYWFPSLHPSLHSLNYDSMRSKLKLNIMPSGLIFRKEYKQAKTWKFYYVVNTSSKHVPKQNIGLVAIVYDDGGRKWKVKSYYTWIWWKFIAFFELSGGNKISKVKSLIAIFKYRLQKNCACLSLKKFLN